MGQKDGISRRTFLFGTAGVTAAAGTAAAQENNSSGGNTTGNASAGGNATGNASAGGNTTGGGDQGAANNQSAGNESGGGNQSGNGSGGGQTVSKTVAVGPNNSFKFEPSEVIITPGSTVTWDWKSDNHNIVVQSQPDGASWKGTDGGKNKTYNTGHTYKHTFETNGSYEYVCWPHRTQGMTGTVTVQETLPTPEPAASQPSVPSSATSLGIASVFAMIATLGLSLFFLKYGGKHETPEQ